LIELLIVIAVIAVMAGLIYSVMMQARRRAYLTECVSNLRQLVMAVHAYEDDWGMIPMRYIPIHKTQEGEFGFVTQLIYPYVKDRRIYICPEDDTPGIDAIWDKPIIWRGENWATSYEYYVNEVSLKREGISIPPVPPRLVLFLCFNHSRSLNVDLISRYDGTIEIAPVGRYKTLGVITKP
jgi:type II secretory pathway pseudopilin PulG